MEYKMLRRKKERYKEFKAIAFTYQGFDE